MPATITRTPTSDGLVAVTRYAVSACGNFDDQTGWVECPHCQAVLIDEWNWDITDECIAHHASGACQAAAEPTEAPAPSDEPF